ncbi:MAG: hypothetical protein V1800_01665 [Candidatus Latescibacterota bacterium]
MSNEKETRVRKTPCQPVRPNPIAATSRLRMGVGSRTSIPRFSARGIEPENEACWNVSSGLYLIRLSGDHVGVCTRKTMLLR